MATSIWPLVLYIDNQDKRLQDQIRKRNIKDKSFRYAAEGRPNVRFRRYDVVRQTVLVFQKL